jgi:aryl sulfotransferase
VTTIRPPTRDHRSAIEDSRRWERFEHRPDDMFISTPPKSGTTWTQGIVASLLWPAGDPPGHRNSLSPWVDVRFRPVDVMLAELAAQQHRRFIKTHSPADCTPIFEQCKYVTVYRDGRDALMSWANHRAAMRPELTAFLNSTAEAEGIEPIAERWSGDMDELFDEWVSYCSPIVHLASWWPLRHEPFVYFLHYNDLKADLEGEMRRLAAFLEIDVPEQHWAPAVERCGLEQMRDDPGNAGMELAFEGGAAAFFFQGTNGRWRDVLTPEQLDRYDRLVADGLPAEAAAWFEQGSLALGERP